MKNNSIAYQDELRAGLSFGLGISINLMQATLAKLDAQRKKKVDPELSEMAKDRVRDGVMTALQGIMSLLRLPELKSENAQALGKLLQDELPRFQPIMTPDMTATIQALARDSAASIKHAEVRKILQAIANPQAAPEKTPHIDRRSE